MYSPPFHFTAEKHVDSILSSSEVERGRVDDFTILLQKLPTALDRYLMALRIKLELQLCFTERDLNQRRVNKGAEIEIRRNSANVIGCSWDPVRAWPRF